MKIAYVITRSDVMGGASVHLLDLASAALRSGHEVLIYVGGDGILFEKAFEKSIDCESLTFLRREINPFYDLACYLELKPKLSKFKPDIVHLHSSKAGILGRLVSKSLNIPSVFTAHGWAFTEGVSKFNRALYLYIEKFMAKYVSRIITVSEFDRQLALKNNVGTSDKVVTIHNGMPNITYEKDSQLVSNIVKFIMVARFDHPKDHKSLIKAFSIIKEQNWTLELVGDGPLLQSMIDYAKKLGIGDKIVFSGACSNVPERLKKSDVFCLISNWEGFPLTIIEAMRAGLPVIASSVGGVSESVVDGKTGYLVSRGDISKISLVLQKLIQSEGSRISFGRNGRLLYEREFEFERMFQKTMKVYNDVLAEKL